MCELFADLNASGGLLQVASEVAFILLFGESLCIGYSAMKDSGLAGRRQQQHMRVVETGKIKRSDAERTREREIERKIEGS